MGVLESGTFKIAGAKLLSVTEDAAWSPGGSFPADFDWVSVSGTNEHGTYTCGFIAGHSTLICSGASGTSFIEDPPPGFTPTTSIFGSHAVEVFFIDVDDEVTVNFGGIMSSRSGISTTPPPACTFSDGIAYPLLSTALLVVDVTAVGEPFTSGSFAQIINQSDIFIQGNYIIVIRWWTIPPVDACGETHTSQLVYQEEDPGDPYVPLDPDDIDAAPTPIVLAVMPTSGVPAGGTPITITGSGFGQGATVAIDGVAATAVVVVDQFTITAVTPAHAAGTVDVVVTNPDGVVST